MPVDTHTARMDLNFSLAERRTDSGEPAGIGGTVEFRTDVFDADTIATLIARLQRVLTVMTADPTARLSSVDLLDDDEHARLAAMGNHETLTRPAPRPVSVPALFAEHVARTPGATAVTYGDRSWTYRELDDAANRLAHLLTRREAGPGQCVAVLFNRSAEAIIAILAVLKTGAAYLPIDPSVPDARLEFVLTDAAPVAVVTTADLAERVQGRGVAVVDVSELDATAAAGGLPTPRADDIAYLIYTSGTTGVPKGVAVTHHNVTQLLESLDAGLPRPGVWPQCHSLAFDVSVWEIFGALLRGGRVVVVPEDVAVSPDDFHALLVGERVDVLTPDTLCGKGVADRRLGVGGVGRGRRSLLTRGGRAVGSWPRDDQCVRSHRDHDVRGDQYAPAARSRRADRLTGSRSRAVGARRVAASGACRSDR